MAVAEHVGKGESGMEKALRQAVSDSQFLVEYKDEHGLLLPQYGGCWHTESNTVPYHDFKLIPICRCGKRGRAYHPNDFVVVEKFANPNLATPDGFFVLLNAMKAREDFDYFMCRLFYRGYNTPQDAKNDNDGYLHMDYIDPITFPGIVRAYLEGRK